MTIIIPSIDPVWVAAIGVMLTLATLHLLFLPGYFRRYELSRPVTYVFGVGTIGVGFTLLNLFARHDLRAIADFWILVGAAFVSTIGLRAVKKYLDYRAALEVLNNGKD